MGLTPDELDKLEARIETVEEEHDNGGYGSVGMANKARHSGRLAELKWVRDMFSETGEDG